MKKNYSTKLVIALIFFLIGIINLNAQMVYLPDTNFRNELIVQGYGGCIIGDSIDSSCPLVTNATKLNVSASNIYDLQGVQAFANIHKLNCDTNHLSTLPSLPVLLDTLLCDSNLISSFSLLPNSLRYIDCSWNSITNLPILPDSLRYLNCSSNQMTNLPALPDSLRYLDCEYNQLIVLSALPVLLTYLNCSVNPISNLPSLPISLITLYCAYNQITNLPLLPSYLQELYCQYNNLSSLTVLPTSLLYLDCHGNHLTSIYLPPNLISMICGTNLLTALPAFPPSLSILICDNNLLTSLPELPTNLLALFCYQNFLVSLPSLPITLWQLDCNHNSLTSLPEFPDSMASINCSDNPDLNCLPQLKKIIGGLDFSNTGVTCLPNYGTVTYSNPVLSSIPLCTMYNDTNHCKLYSNISGKSFFDNNSNCSQDSSEVLLQNMKVKLYQNGSLMQQTFTGGEGLYSFIVDSSFGNYQVTLDTNDIPLNVFCPANDRYYDTIISSNSFVADNDFAMRCKNSFDVGVQSLVASRFRPARQATVKIAAGDISNFYGVHCANGISGSVTVTFVGPTTYVGPDIGALNPIISGNTLTYNIADFGTIDFFNSFNFIMLTDSFAAVNSNVCFTVTVSPIAGDNNPANNTLVRCCHCHVSFDPNEKEVDPISEVDLTGSKWLTYTIYFQNTGTAEAEHIYIDDTLDSHLDLSTFQLIAYSHQPLVQILIGGIARFNFPNINLPDSNTNEPASHGYVQYKIKLKDNAPVGTQVSNTAYIYFDFNTPVVTNTTVNTVMTSIGISEITKNDLQVSVFPNPTRDEFIVQSSKYMAGKKIMLKVVDTYGKEMLNKQVTAVNTKLEAGFWSSGIYFLRIETVDGVVVKKLVKE